jgi:cytosine/adenosine deaminase-related metal-dependent hydrolase
MTTVIKHAVIYTNNRSLGTIWDGSLAIEGSRIVDVGKSDDLLPKYASADRVIDGKWKLVTPGLIDTHMHLDAAYLRGLIPPKWMGWLRAYFGWYFDLIDEKDFYYSALFSIGKRLLTGTTTIVDSGPLPGLERRAVEAVEKSGVRANLNRITMDVYDQALGEDGFSSKHREDTDKAIRNGYDFVKRYNGHLGRVKAGLCLMQVPTSSETLGKEARRIVDELDGTLHTHAGVHGELLERTTKLHGVGDIEYLDKIGVLCKRMTAAHMGWLSEAEMGLVASRGVNVSHCPTSTTINGKGILYKGNIVRMYKMGVNIGLGTDELDITDMVRVMFAALIHRDVWMDSGLFPLEKIVEMATINGAEATGMGKELGTITKGQLADLVLFDLKNVDLIPAYEYSLLPNLITSASGASVDTVMIHGELVVENRRIKTFDMNEVVTQVQERAARYIESAVKEGMHATGAQLSFSSAF